MFDHYINPINIESIKEEYLSEYKLDRNNLNFKYMEESSACYLFKKYTKAKKIERYICATMNRTYVYFFYVITI